MTVGPNTSLTNCFTDRPNEADNQNLGFPKMIGLPAPSMLVQRCRSRTVQAPFASDQMISGLPTLSLMKMIRL
jgi:hypothetical protein